VVLTPQEVFQVSLRVVEVYLIISHHILTLFYAFFLLLLSTHVFIVVLDLIRICFLLILVLKHLSLHYHLVLAFHLLFEFFKCFLILLFLLLLLLLQQLQVNLQVLV
jgi:hypothetical protein